MLEELESVDLASLKAELAENRQLMEPLLEKVVANTHRMKWTGAVVWAQKSELFIQYPNKLSALLAN